MKKIIILMLIVAMFLTGCGLFNLNGWVVPDDLEFLEVVESLNTPEKICAYMKENFTYEPHIIYAPDPYTLWKLKEGDCNDFETFARFVANYHDYETYQIRIHFKKTFVAHVMTIFKENEKYTYSNIKAYYPINVSTFKEVVEHFFSLDKEYELDYYEVYDYNMNNIEG